MVSAARASENANMISIEEEDLLHYNTLRKSQIGEEAKQSEKEIPRLKLDGVAERERKSDDEIKLEKRPSFGPLWDN
ncbi:hypothetical protein P8452_15625 [Trifolium repens]|nr:hypothetical protein P8452_15625 [Trifolium repens]